MTYRIERTEIIGEVETRPGGKMTKESAALHMIADHVGRTADTTGSYTVKFGDVTVGVDLFTPREDGDNGSPA
jgi:hypothetical protein